MYLSNIAQGYIDAISDKSKILAQSLIGGRCVKDADNNNIWYYGGNAIVVPFITQMGKQYAVRCWCNPIDNAEYRYKKINKILQNKGLQYFVDYIYEDRGIIVNDIAMPILCMDWVSALSLKDYISTNLTNKGVLYRLSMDFVDMVKELHINNITHGDLNHNNILIMSNGGLKLIDYDSICYKEDIELSSSTVGLLSYQHPSRIQNNSVSLKIDYFSEFILFISLNIVIEQPNLWYHYNCDQDRDYIFFTQDDFADINNSSSVAYISSLSPNLYKLMTLLKYICNVEHYDQIKPIENILMVFEILYRLKF